MMRRVMISGVALLAPVLAGCEAGNDAGVLQFHPAANGAAGSTASLTVSDVFILGGPNGQAVPAGGSASMFLSVYNAGPAADQLVSVDTAGAARSVQLAGGSFAVPAQAMTGLEGPQPKVVLRNLSKELTAGSTVEVLLSFRNAGSMELSVPVEARSTYYSSFSPPAPAPSASKRVRVGATSPAGVSASPATGTGTSTPAAPAAPAAPVP
jgi:copper(I)-binding protein